MAWRVSRMRVERNKFHVQAFVTGYNQMWYRSRISPAPTVSRAIKSCQKFHLESVACFAGLAGMIFASLT